MTRTAWSLPAARIWHTAAASPGEEQDPAVWRVLRAGQEVFRTEGGDVYVLRNWQPDAPDLFVVSDTWNYEGNADNHYTVYDADGTQLLEQKGPSPPRWRAAASFCCAASGCSPAPT